MRTLLATMILLLGTSSVSAEPPAAPLAGNAERGQAIFGRCRTCHYPEQGFGHHNGPSLWGIFGRKAGSAEGYQYSDAMKNAGFTWTPELLDFWLANPKTFLRDSTMVVFPLSAQERADVIAYLRQFHD